MLIARLRCWFDGHDLRFADDPRPREHHPSGRPILRKARVVCERCGWDSLVADERHREARP